MSLASELQRSLLPPLETWLHNPQDPQYRSLARTAVQAAEAQFTAWPGAKLAAVTVARLAKGVTPLDKKIAEVDALVEARFREHPHGWEAFDRRTETAWWSRKNVERGGGEGAFRRSVP